MENADFKHPSHCSGGEHEARQKPKNPDKHRGKWGFLPNLEKNGFFRFQLALIFALVMVYSAFQFTVAVMPPPDVADPGSIEEDVTYEVYPERKIIIEPDKVPEKVPKVKQVKNPTKIKIVDDREKVLAANVIDDVEPSPDLKVSDIDYTDEGPPVEVPTMIINLVEEAPIFPGCENVAKDERVACFQKQLQKHIKRKFRYPELAQSLKQQGRVNVVFKIGVDGTIEDLRLKGPHQILEKEAARIMGSVPQVVPAKHGGKPVKVNYSIPITFKLY
ncbi:energy transducer TonB [Sediminicola luteus]|uniref:TonB C-terminal domain-containing protein n=1 Tax=Sediminicola luteus TaxID=319238 RepID=A0A2A4G5H6_9FLAO|nr:energy transducer TonB [Sediminicola luteus]PCE63238.1 hypothetical protein B7P33_13500 [Sediminicola luteus]